MSFLDRLEKLKKGREEEVKKAEILERIGKEREEREKELARMDGEKEKEAESLVADFRKKKENEYREKIASLKRRLDEEIRNLEEKSQALLKKQKEREKEFEELSRRLQTEGSSPFKNLERQRLRILKKELEISSQEFKKMLTLKANREKERTLAALSEEDWKIKMEKEIGDYADSLRKEKKEKETVLKALKQKTEKAQKIEAEILLKQAEEDLAKEKEKTEPAASPASPAMVISNKGLKKLASLWEKATGKKLVPESSGPPSVAPGLQGLAELKIDFFKGDSKIIIYAPAPGARIEDIDISLEEENDILTVKGLAKQPEKEKGEDGKFIIQECQWGPFFRQINLNAEINVFGIRAKLENGILILELPVLKLGEEKKGIKKIKIEE